MKRVIIALQRKFLSNKPLQKIIFKLFIKKTNSMNKRRASSCSLFSTKSINGPFFTDTALQSVVFDLLVAIQVYFQFLEPKVRQKKFFWTFSADSLRNWLHRIKLWKCCSLLNTRSLIAQIFYLIPHFNPRFKQKKTNAFDPSQQLSVVFQRLWEINMHWEPQSEYEIR